MKKFLAILLALTMSLSLAACGSEPNDSGDANPVQDEQTSSPEEDDAVDSDESSDAQSSEAASVPEETTVLRIASLKGPTTMGMVKMMSDASENYEFNMYGTADEIVGLLTNGDVDIANIPCNLASVLYKKTGKGLSVLDINTLGVLYVLYSVDPASAENTEYPFTEIADLKGKTVYSTGKGTTPEYVFNYILRSNGLDPEKDLTVEYLSEATEVAAKMAESTDAIAVLPQPYVTVAMTQNQNLNIAFDLTEEWEKIDGSQLVTGVTVIRNEVLESYPQAVANFMEDYADSVDYVNANTKDAAALIEQFDIVKAAVAEKALPYCNIVHQTGEEMKTNISAYLKVLYDSDPSSVGGEIPDDQFYYIEG